MVGVFLIGFGQPESLDRLKDFLQEVTGRTPSEEMLRSARSRYERIGGSSPLVEITKRQARALKALLEESGVTHRICIAMRYSAPRIDEVISCAQYLGVRSAVVITLAPQYSEMSAGAYLSLFDEAYAKSRADFKVNKVRSYGLHPLFIDAVAENLKVAMEVEPALNPQTDTVIFSAHSLPKKIIDSGDPYAKELEGGIKAVAERLNLGKVRLAFQSKGGGASEWIGPSIEEVLEDLARAGEKRVVVSPIGFVSDHVETLYDLDILAREKANQLGFDYRRAPSLNDSPAFIKLLAALVKENLP